MSEKCQYCESNLIDSRSSDGFIAKHKTSEYECGTFIETGLCENIHQSKSCERIAKLEAESKRLRGLISHAWDSGYECCSKAYAGDHYGLVESKSDFFKSNGLGEV